MSNRILDYLKGITKDTTDLANDSTPMPKSTRILDYVKDISEDTSAIVESGGGGGEGGESAGFGTPTATATQLEPDQEPTVSVESSGPNTAKVFSFTFGIPKGEKGDKGDTGAQGEPGEQGAQGEPGATGAQGEKGDTGAAAGFGTPTASATQLEAGAQPTVQVSATGDNTAKVFAFVFGIPKGEKGDTGAKGEQGVQGEPGAKGDTGADGTPAGFGTPTASATQLEAGVQPTVSVQASGEDTAKVFAFSFVIPKGEKGDTGAKGEQGEPGAKGDTGADGTPAGFGTPTASATQLESAQQPTVQVTASGENTEKVFNFVFGIPKGEKGDKGDTGAQGATGETGPAGADGADGVTPTITATAQVDSTTGTPAVQVTKSGTETAPSFKFSFTGLKGETGAKGEKGDTGEIGPQGPQGEIGPQGPAGTVTVSQPDYYGTDVSSTGVATYTIPNYASTNIVEVYLNGFRLELTAEYTISSEGVVTTVNSVNSGGRLLVVVWRF